MVADLGGQEYVSKAQQLVIERAIRAKLWADGEEAWLDEQPMEARLDSRLSHWRVLSRPQLAGFQVSTEASTQTHGLQHRLIASALSPDTEFR